MDGLVGLWISKVLLLINWNILDNVEFVNKYIVTKYEIYVGIDIVRIVGQLI